MQRSSENVGLPDFDRIVLEILHQVPDELLALLLGTDNRREFRFDVDADHMDRRCRCLQPDAEPRALTDQLRLVERHLGKRRCSDAVACRLDHLERFREPVVFPLRMRELLHQLKQMIFAADLDAYDFH
ncbi:hypothetical protein D3C84_848330 [compost metagenome]